MWVAAKRDANALGFGFVVGHSHHDVTKSAAELRQKEDGKDGRVSHTNTARIAHLRQTRHVGRHARHLGRNAAWGESAHAQREQPQRVTASTQAVAGSTRVLPVSPIHGDFAVVGNGGTREPALACIAQCHTATDTAR